MICGLFSSKYLVHKHVHSLQVSQVGGLGDGESCPFPVVAVIVLMVCYHQPDFIRGLVRNHLDCNALGPGSNKFASDQGGNGIRSSRVSRQLHIMAWVR
jgi:hypothetical protein